MGCGAIGSVIARHLAAHPGIGEVCLADVDIRWADRVTSEIGHAKLTPIALDASNAAAVEAAARGATVVINSSVPRFNPIIQRAALTVGAHYLDLASDSSDPFGPDPMWRAAGKTAIVGLGEDPGLSNLMVRYAADSMDRVDSIRVRDGDTGTSTEYPFICLFSPETFVEETLHTSRIWEEGRYSEVPPFGRKEIYDFPAPVGPQPVYSVDHEEVDTLPVKIGKGVQYVDFKLALDDNAVRTLTFLRDLKLLERGPAGGPNPRQAVFATIPKPSDLTGKIDGSAALVVEVRGHEKGQTKQHMLYTVLDHRDASARYHATGTAYLTGSPAAVGAILLATGEIRTPGLFSPESLDPRPFLSLLKERGIVVHERVTWERIVP
ncbi:MAG: saccharopine dehydrogenase C-terminal domain-containing protein [Thermoplasmata archaeon]